MNQNTEKSPKSVLDRNRGQTYWEERAILDFTEDALALMARRNVSKADLAKMIDTAPPYVSKLLAGTNNYTIKTMVKVARALKAKLKISLEADESCMWEEFWIPNQVSIQHVKQRIHFPHTRSKADDTVFAEFVEARSASTFLIEVTT